LSNCIDILKGDEVVFLADEIDIKGFERLVNNAKDLIHEAGKSGNDFTQEELSSNMAWWFLQKNSDICDEGVVIRFGHGRSTHTNRDFKGVIQTLIPLIKRVKRHKFQITDEFDGHRQRFWMTVEFKSGSVS
jgi:hypothetical protein